MSLYLLLFSATSTAGQPSGSLWLGAFVLLLLAFGFAVWSVSTRNARRNLRHDAATQPNGEELSAGSITMDRPSLIALIAQKSTAVKIAGRLLTVVLAIGAGAAGDRFYAYQRDHAAWKAIIQDYNESYAAWLARQPKTENNRELSAEK